MASDETYRLLGPLTGDVNFIIEGNVVATRPAAPHLSIPIALNKTQRYAYAAVYTGDPNHFRTASPTAVIQILDPPLVLANTTIAVTQNGPNYYYVDATFRDANGAALTDHALLDFDARLTATNGFIANLVGHNPRHWELTLPQGQSSFVTVTVAGEPVVSATVGPPPPRRRAARP